MVGSGRNRRCPGHGSDRQSMPWMVAYHGESDLAGKLWFYTERSVLLKFTSFEGNLLYSAEGVDFSGRAALIRQIRLFSLFCVEITTYYTRRVKSSP